MKARLSRLTSGTPSHTWIDPSEHYPGDDDASGDLAIGADDTKRLLRHLLSDTDNRGVQAPVRDTFR